MSNDCFYCLLPYPTTSTLCGTVPPATSLRALGVQANQSLACSPSSPSKAHSMELLDFHPSAASRRGLAPHMPPSELWQCVQQLPADLIQFRPLSLQRLPKQTVDVFADLCTSFSGGTSSFKRSTISSAPPPLPYNGSSISCPSDPDPSRRPGWNSPSLRTF